MSAVGVSSAEAPGTVGSSLWVPWCGMVRLQVGGAIAIKVFIGCLPTYGFQIRVLHPVIGLVCSTSP